MPTSLFFSNELTATILSSEADACCVGPSVRPSSSWRVPCIHPTRGSSTQPAATSSHILDYSAAMTELHSTLAGVHGVAACAGKSTPWPPIGISDELKIARDVVSAVITVAAKQIWVCRRVLATAKVAPSPEACSPAPGVVRISPGLSTDTT
ncbi:hypothetical protein M9H77_26364 [Catharanthus roseus]|uniref:Uncharacterized protein n=1 Tax=Catharanthus roseus TaxID=4058 RepID=A0ACC0ADI4_CATRO|nr:hypothetical protein M9H77_26364 [Catharanthus roseus]